MFPRAASERASVLLHPAQRHQLIEQRVDARRATRSQAAAASSAGSQPETARMTEGAALRPAPIHPILLQLPKLGDNLRAVDGVAAGSDGGHWQADGN
jgi:hypothetical protein